MEKTKDYEEKKRIGVMACIEALGKDFYYRHENSVYSCGETEKGFHCFVGVNTYESAGDSWVLTNAKFDGSIDKERKSNNWEYYASCYVLEKNGEYVVVMDECKLPSDGV